MNHREVWEGRGMRVVKMATVVLLLGLGVMSASAATPANVGPTQTVKISLPSDYDDITQIIGSGTSWLVVGNIDKSTVASSQLFPNEVSKGESDGYVAMLDPGLHLVWSHRFGTSHDDVATAIVRDRYGVIWSVGVTTKEVQSIPSPTPTATVAPSPLSPDAPVPTVNPDGVLPATTPSPPMVADQLLISSWSSSGQLLTQNLWAIADGVAIVPTAVVAGKSGVYVVGTAVNVDTGNSRGFYLLVTKDGAVGPIHWIGSKAIALRAAVLLGNGSLVVAGSIAEVLKGKPAIGLVDAYLATVNPTTGVILRSQRSGTKSATRSWESVSSDRLGNLMATGVSRVGSKSEVVATSFGPTGSVKFSLRLAKPLGTQIALPAPMGAFASIAVATSRPGRSGIEAYLTPVGATGRLLTPAYLVGKAGFGLIAAAASKGYLLASSDLGGLTLAWFAPRIRK